MTWKYDIFRGGEHGGYLVDSGFFAQREHGTQTPTKIRILHANTAHTHCTSVCQT